MSTTTRGTALIAGASEHRRRRCDLTNIVVVERVTVAKSTNSDALRSDGGLIL